MPRARIQGQITAARKLINRPRVGQTPETQQYPTVRRGAVEPDKEISPFHQSPCSLCPGFLFSDHTSDRDRHEKLSAHARVHSFSLLRPLPEPDGRRWRTRQMGTGLLPRDPDHPRTAVEISRSYPAMHVVAASMFIHNTPLPVRSASRRVDREISWHAHQLSRRLKCDRQLPCAACTVSRPISFCLCFCSRILVILSTYHVTGWSMAK